MSNITESKTGSATYSAAIADAQNYMSWIVAKFRPYLRDTIVEVGVGHGNYAAFLSPLGRYIGVDVDAASVEDAKARFPENEFLCADILKGNFLSERLPTGADAVVSINVLEHIEDDARAAHNLVEALKPGGHLLISVPAIQGLYNDLDTLAGHYRRYTRRRLKQVFANEPILIKELSYFNPLGGLGWWINGVKRHKSLDSELVNGQIRLFDRYLVPMSRFVDPMTRSFFGQSVTFIGERQ